MQPWMYSIIAILPIVAFWVVYRLVKTFQNKSNKDNEQ